jgi:hypothetical protein
MRSVGRHPTEAGGVDAIAPLLDEFEAAFDYFVRMRVGV